eukprot:jgi/Psemu1/307150/fgenesh1_kg.306_\
MNRKCVHQFPFERNSSKRSRNETDSLTLTNKRRKLAPLEINHNPGSEPPAGMKNISKGNDSRNMASHATIRAGANGDSSASSDSSSDSESSIVSSSSNSSNSTFLDSRCQDSRRLVSGVRSCKQKVQSDNLADIPSSSVHTTISEAVKCEPDLIVNENVPTIDKNESAVKEEAKPNRTQEEDNNASCNLDVVPLQALPNTDDDASESRLTSSSLLSKTETMAVFENFSF